MKHSGSKPAKAGRSPRLLRLAAGFRACVCGSVAIELALLTPVLAALLIGSVDLGTYIYKKMQLQSASRAGAQYAIQSGGNAEDEAGIAAAILASSSDLDAGVGIDAAAFCGCIDGSETPLSDTTGCSTTCPGGDFPGLSVRVTVTNTYTPIFPYPGIPDNIVLRGSTSLRVP